MIPTTPGDYVFTRKRDGKAFRITVYPAGNSLRVCGFNHEQHARYDDPIELVSLGHWELLAPPEPHKFPAPPKVELWEGIDADSLDEVSILKVDGDEFCKTEGSGWYYSGNDYTNLRKVGDYTLERSK